MDDAEQPDITQLLHASRQGDRRAMEALMAAVEPELRRLAAARLGNERPDHTLQPTALINELYLNLFQQNVLELRNRAHFFAIAAHRMRQILIDHARKKRASKRGGGAQLVSLDENVASPASSVDVLDLHRGLEELAELDPRQARTLELHYFGGLTVSEIATELVVGSATVKRDLRTGRGWLAHRLGAGKNSDAT